jgi:hypothetical protein
VKLDGALGAAELLRDRFVGSTTDESAQDVDMMA